VKRLLYTSSGLTLLFGNDEKKILNEDDWADPTKCSHYPKAKILAEKALWELYNGQDHKSAHTEMVSVLPTLALGPGLTAHGNSSETMVLDILTGAFPGYPDVDLFLTAVDVRDVAKGHIKAMFTPALAGQRIALAGTHINLSEIIKILKK
jgi:dihydroflavonol-4-reductase